MVTRAHRLHLHVVPGRFALCRLAASDAIPDWADGAPFTSITRTATELSIVCAEQRVPRGTQCETGYVALGVEGTLAPDLVGVMVSLATPLADAGIPIIAIGTYDTDYILVPAGDQDRALEALRAAGHSC